MSERYKCARCGSLLTVTLDDGCYVVHPCLRCTPHPALAASAEDFAELRRDVDVLMARVTALEAARVQPTTVPMRVQYTPEPQPERWSSLFGVRSAPQQMTPPVGPTWSGPARSGIYTTASTPQQVTQTKSELEKAMTPPPQTTTGGTGEERAEMLRLEYAGKEPPDIEY